MARVSRSQRARLRVSRLDRLYLDLHGTTYSGVDPADAWAVVGRELVAAAVALEGTRRLPEGFWRFDPGIPAELRPHVYPSGRTGTSGEQIVHRHAWLTEHPEVLA